MRRPGRKHGVRSNRGVKYCPSCSRYFTNCINDELINEIKYEIYAECTSADERDMDRAEERKRIVKSQQRVESDVKNDSGVDSQNIKSKRQCSEYAWKKVDKQLIMKVMRSDGAFIVGDPCHKCVIIDRSRHHNTSKDSTKGKFKHSKSFAKAYKGFNASEAMESFSDSSSDLAIPC